jgi:hypothetical protein
VRSAGKSDGTGFTGRFELKSQAGTGEMGTVYQAIDRQTDRVLGRRLARAWLLGAGRTVPESLAHPASQSSQRLASSG